MVRNIPTRVLSIMKDGSLIADDVEDFAHYIALVLGYKRDEDCRWTHVYGAGERVLQIWRWAR
jgi:hypothetical protein